MSDTGSREPGPQASVQSREGSSTRLLDEFTAWLKTLVSARVVAREGDRVRIVAGRVYRNDVLLDDSFVPAQYRSHEDWGPEVVPDGYYCVMGDHRNSSSDSRTWGYVPQRYIIGRVQLRWWPMPEARIF